MKRLLILLAFFVVKLNAQDTIRFKNGFTKAVKVSEIGLTEVRYNDFNNLTQQRAADVVRAVQAAICAGLEAVEDEAGSDARFLSDEWTRPGSGGGLTRVLQGAVIEKGGVSTSTVFGELSPTFAAQMPGSGLTFFATGVSLVLHPRNPYVPTVHANFRYIEHGSKRWVGGGADLTPYYFYPEDKRHFHGVWQRLCEDHPGVGDHGRFREWCERYFYLKHRGEEVQP